MKDLIQLYREEAAGIDKGAAPGVAVAEPPVADKPIDGSAAVDLKPGSASATVDLNSKPVDKTAETFVIPEAFRDKPYLKGVDSQEKLFKMLDGAQNLIGQKGPALPKADAPQAEWDTYYESIGRPKTAAEYAFDGADKADPKFLPKVQEAMHKAGLTPTQAKTVWDNVQVALGDFVKDNNMAAQQADVDFDKLANDSFGVERGRILATSKDLLEKNTSANMKPLIAKLSNENLIVLADVLNNINKRYIKQDGPGGLPNVNIGTPDELRSKARGLMADQLKHNPMSIEWQNLQKQIDGLYNNMRSGQR